MVMRWVASLIQTCCTVGLAYQCFSRRLAPQDKDRSDPGATWENGLLHAKPPSCVIVVEDRFDFAGGAAKCLRMVQYYIAIRLYILPQPSNEDA